MPSYRPAGYAGSVGGGEISNRLLLEGLVALGHEVVVVTTNAGGCGDCTEKGVRIVEVSETGNSMVAYVKSRLRFRRILKRMAVHVTKPDVIVASTEALGVALSVAHSSDLPVAFFIRAYENLEKPKTILGMVKRSVKTALLGNFGPEAVGRANLILPNSEYMAGVCREKVPGIVRSAVVYPPVDYELAPMDQHRVPKTVSMVGTSAKKGAALFEGLADRFPELNFRMVGCPGVSVEGEQVKRNLVLVGWCDVRAEFEEKADLILAPSLWPEPFGRVAVEGLAAGKIVLVSDIGGLPEAVAFQQMLTLQPGNLNAWSEALRCVISGPSAYYKATETARDQINRFGVKRQVEALEEALLSLVGTVE